MHLPLAGDAVVMWIRVGEGAAFGRSFPYAYNHVNSLVWPIAFFSPHKVVAIHLGSIYFPQRVNTMLLKHCYYSCGLSVGSPRQHPACHQTSERHRCTCAAGPPCCAAHNYSAGPAPLQLQTQPELSHRCVRVRLLQLRAGESCRCSTVWRLLVSG